MVNSTWQEKAILDLLYTHSKEHAAFTVTTRNAEKQIQPLNCPVYCSVKVKGLVLTCISACSST